MILCLPPTSFTNISLTGIFIFLNHWKRPPLWNFESFLPPPLASVPLWLCYRTRCTTTYQHCRPYTTTVFRSVNSQHLGCSRNFHWSHVEVYSTKTSHQLPHTYHSHIHCHRSNIARGLPPCSYIWVKQCGYSYLSNFETLQRNKVLTYQSNRQPFCSLILFWNPRRTRYTQIILNGRIYFAGMSSLANVYCASFVLKHTGRQLHISYYFIFCFMIKVSYEKWLQ